MEKYFLSKNGNDITKYSFEKHISHPLAHYTLHTKLISNVSYIYYKIKTIKLSEKIG